jgi:hypothetical protein
VDTSSLLDAWCRWYPRSLFPTLWERIEELASAGKLISSEEVYRELQCKDDALFAWAQQRKGIFLPLSAEIQRVAREILDKFPTLVDSRTGKSFADPFVVATARVTDSAVVTGERPTGSVARPRIPDVCQSYGIPCFGITDVIREERWSF